MPSHKLPAAALVRLEQILADTELAIIAAAEQPDEIVHFPDFVVLVNPVAEARRTAAMTAAAAIVDIITALDWPATDRRRTVETWHDQVRQRCGIARTRFLAERRQQPWWLNFQTALGRAEPPPVPPINLPVTTKPARIVAFKKQLAAAMTAKRVLTPELAEAVPTTERTIRYYLAGTRIPRRRGDIIRQLEHVLGTTFDFAEQTVPKNKRVRRRTPKRAKTLRKTRRNVR